jgi:hypothetical protein
MEKLIVQHEKLIEERLLGIVKERPEALEIKDSSSGSRNLADLLGGHKPTIFHDTNDFNPNPKFMQDLIGGMTPDIVLRSPVSGSEPDNYRGQGHGATGFRGRGLSNHQIFSVPARQHN